MDWNVEFWWGLVNVVVAAMGPWIANWFLWRLDIYHKPWQKK